MATLYKRRKQWVSRISKWNGIKKIITDIPLRTENKIIARTRHQKVEKLEKDIKDGLRFEFSWLKKNGGRTTLLRYSVRKASFEWLLYRKAIIRESHYLRNIISIDRFIDVVGKETPIDSISSKHIENFKIYYHNRHKPNGINLNLRCIKTFLKWCEDRNYLFKAPRFKMMRVPNQLPRYITEDQFDKIINSDIDTHYKKAFYLYRSTGCRKNEIFNGIIKGSWLIISAEYSKTNTEKNIKVNRKQIEIINDMKSRLNKGIKNGFNPKNIIDKYNKIFVNCCKKIGIYDNGISLHSLRHTYAVMRYLETKDIYQVKMDLGHSSVITTEKYAKINILKLEEDFPTLSKIVKVSQRIQGNAIGNTGIGNTSYFSEYDSHRQTA